MIIKFFATGKEGGATAYARRPTDWRQKPRPHGALELYGRGDLLSSIIDASPWEQKYVAGVIAYGEPAAVVFPAVWLETLALVLQYLCGGHDPAEFAIAFVAHVDAKLHAHVHFEVGTRHLPTGRSIPPFRVTQDGVALGNLCRLIDLRQGLRDPDASPQLMNPAPHRASASVRQFYNVICRAMREKYERQEINCRADVIRALRLLGVRIIHQGRDCVVVHPNSKYAKFALRGRLFWEEFTRARFEEEIRGAERERKRPLAERIAQCEEQHERDLELRHSRFAALLGEASPEAQPRTKGQRVAEHRKESARDHALMVSTRKHPLPLEAYSFPLPPRAIDQLRAVGVTFAVGDSPGLRLSGARGSTIAPDLLLVPSGSSAVMLATDASANSDTPSAEVATSTSPASNSEPAWIYEHVTTRLAAARKRLAEIRVRDLALRSMQESARRARAILRSCAALAGRYAALAKRSAEFGRTTADTIAQLDRDARARVRVSAQRIAGEAQAQRVRCGEEPVREPQTRGRGDARGTKPARPKAVTVNVGRPSAPKPSPFSAGPII